MEVSVHIGRWIIVVLIVLGMIIATLPLDGHASGFATTNASTVTSPRGFDGLTQVGAGGAERPDVQVAAGPNHVVEIVNQAVAIYSKLGTQLSSVSLNTFFPRAGTDWLFDSMVVYDSLSSTWIATTVDGTASNVDIAVSNTNDPTQSWHYYTVGGTASHCYDRARIGVSSDKFVVSANSAGYLAPPPGVACYIYNIQPLVGQYWVLNKTDMINARQNVSNATNFSPLFGGASQPSQAVSSTSSIYVESVNPNNSTISVTSINGVPPGQVTLSTTNIASTVNISQPPLAPAKGFACSPTCTIDTFNSQYVQSVSWFNGRLWSSYGVACTPTGDNTTRSCIQLAELNTTTSTPGLLQNFDYGTKGQYLWYPASTVDSNGDMDLLFGYSNSTTYPTLALSGQAWNDPPNSMAARLIVKQSNTCCTASGQWGDYMGAGPDPSNSSLVWTASEYNLNTVNGWSTFISSERLLQGVDFSITVSPSSVTLTAGKTTSVTVTLKSLNNFAGSVGLTATGPSGIALTFTVNPSQVPAGGSVTSTLKITPNINCNIGPGTTITVTGTSGPSSHSASVAIQGAIRGC